VKAGLLLLGVLLAGCLDGGSVPAGLPLDASGDPLPTLHGIVVDGAIRPLPGAVVRFLASEGVNATTDEEGRYEIRRPTARAEDILVTAAKDGFLAKTQRSQVSGHRSIRLDFVLEADPSIVPRVEVLKHSGLVGCDAVAAVAGQRLAQGCDDDEAVYNWEGGRSEAPSSIWDMNPTPGFAGAVVEVDWEAATPGSTELHARLRGPLAGGQPAPTLAEATGPSPLRLEVPADLARDFPRWTALRLYVELAPGQDVPAAGAVDQPFDAFASLFYVEPAPPGYVLT
jgi:hypothetical protein